MPTTKGIRLNTQLREKFERYCRENLLDERAVIEAWLLRFLEAPKGERQAVAKRYAEWLEETGSGEGAGRLKSRKKKPRE